MTKYTKGIWTRDAEVLCPHCHGIEDAEQVELEEWNAVTVCDRCGEEIQIRDNVAYERNLVSTLRAMGIKAYMDQTGGMCSACSIVPSDGLLAKGEDGGVSEVLVTYNMDGEEGYLLGAYYGYDEAGVDWHESYFDTADELIAWVKENRSLFAVNESAIEEAAMAIARKWMEASEEPDCDMLAITFEQQDSTAAAAERFGMEYEDMEGYVYGAVDKIEGSEQ